ncbi:MAG: HipA domain-containing protein [Spirochaetota bacterium]
MMTSKSAEGVYVWTWLPGQVDPVVSGLVSRLGLRYFFNYGRSYLGRPGAVSLNPAELPLVSGLQAPRPGLSMAGCLRDALPDAWGHRVIASTLLTSRGGEDPGHEPSDFDDMLASGSDRIGSLDFQNSAQSYSPRQGQNADLADLARAADLLEAGLPLPPGLDSALLHGTSMGGARPKAFLDSPEGKFIAKFSSSTDEYPVVRAEFLAMRLASLAGLKVAPVHLEKILGKDILVVERFDRVRTPSGWERRRMLSALTLLQLDEMMARYASYELLADILRSQGRPKSDNPEELFARLVFNILCGNNDDHARNHAVFLEGDGLVLTPAYDICPQARAGSVSTQGMLICGQDRRSRLETCLAAAPRFMLNPSKAKGIVDRLLACIHDNWIAVCDLATFTKVERDRLWQRQFLNPYIFEK